MQTTGIESINHTVEKTNAWLDELVEKGPFENQQQAYSHLRAVLHAIRDNLNADEACHLGSQLPMLVRGFYFEGWRPSLAPNVERDRDAFLEHVRSSLGTGTARGPALEETVGAVTALLEEHLSEGQVRHVRDQLHEEIDALWATPAVR